LIVPIGRWALEAACRQARSWQARGLDLYVSVGLSELQCRGGQGERDIQAALDGCELAAGRIELLLPASVMRRHDEAAFAMLERCARRGVRLCLDGYGGGYLNLAYLKRLGIDKFKLELAELMRGDALDCAPLGVLLQGAQALGLRTVVDGVADEATARQLRELGCGEVQGRSRVQALAPDELERWLQVQGLVRMSG
jgi:EAL domain-containing protein (putative c-di-GMP-specific phosphodiesterase class I)